MSWKASSICCIVQIRFFCIQLCYHLHFGHWNKVIHHVVMNERTKVQCKFYSLDLHNHLSHLLAIPTSCYYWTVCTFALFRPLLILLLSAHFNANFPRRRLIILTRLALWGLVHTLSRMWFWVRECSLLRCLHHQHLVCLKNMRALYDRAARHKISSLTF